MIQHHVKSRQQEEDAGDPPSAQQPGKSVPPPPAPGALHRQAPPLPPPTAPPPPPEGVDCEAAVLDPSPDKLLAVLQGVWGHGSFRGLQLEAVQSVMQGQSTLAIMPTGTRFAVDQPTTVSTVCKEKM